MVISFFSASTAQPVWQSVIAPQRRSSISPLDNDILQVRFGQSAINTAEDFVKTVVPTSNPIPTAPEIANWAQSITNDESNELNSGTNVTTFRIPEMPDYVLRTYFNRIWPEGASHSLEQYIKENLSLTTRTENVQAPYNIGQELYELAPGVTIAKLVPGNAFAQEYSTESDAMTRDLKRYRETLDVIARLDEEAYRHLIRVVRWGEHQTPPLIWECSSDNLMIVTQTAKMLAP
jgi:hypothetical protein